MIRLALAILLMPLVLFGIVLLVVFYTLELATAGMAKVIWAVFPPDRNSDVLEGRDSRSAPAQKKLVMTAPRTGRPFIE